MKELSSEGVPVVASEAPLEGVARSGGFVRSLGLLAGRSLFPITAVIIIGGTILWGPWVTLVVAWLWWRIVGTFA